MIYWKRKTLVGFLILIVGGLGGILADQFLLPYLSVKHPFSEIEFIRRAANGTTIINPTQEIVISENEAIERAIEKISSSLVLVQSFNQSRLLNQGTGFIITSDGLIVTAGDIIESEANRYVVSYNGDNYQAELVKKDLEKNIALLRVEGQGLTMVSMIGAEEFALGERVILAGVALNKDEELTKFVNLGIISSIQNENQLSLNFQETDLFANGSPLVNDKGELIGMNLINEKDQHRVVSSDIIRNFTGL